VAAVGCVIPALDAADTVGAVVLALREALAAVRHERPEQDGGPAPIVIVVDDGSRDATAAIAAACADRVVRFPTTRGKGAALRAGLALALTEGAERVLTIDADGQHDPSYAPALLAALECADLAVGSRARRGTAMPWPRRVSNALSARLVSACAGRAVPDSQSGFRALRADTLRRLRPAGDGYEFETDMLIRAGRAGLRIACVPIPTIYGAPSHFRPVRDTARIARTIARAWIGRPWSAGATTTIAARAASRP